ncbi:MAG: arginase family protein [Gemmataceae bacterium]
MKTTIHVFPFDLFGSPGARAGAELLADAVREMLDDNRRERTPTRGRSYTKHVELIEHSFDKLADYADWRSEASETLERDNAGFRFWLAGNHLGVLPVYDWLSANADDTLILQFDAHLDIHGTSDCTAELSHGNFLLHARTPRPAVVNIGHRDLVMKPEYIAKHYADAIPAIALLSDAEKTQAALLARCEKAKRIWIDLDCDVFDVAYFPAVAQSQPFGLATTHVLQLLDLLWSAKIIGLSISEFDTARDVRDQSLATLAWLIEWALLRIYGG